MSSGKFTKMCTQMARIIEYQTPEVMSSKQTKYFAHFGIIQSNQGKINNWIEENPNYF